MPGILLAADSDTQTYRLFGAVSCPGGKDNSLTCFVGEVWRFSQTAILVLSIAVMVIAGIIYMTSAGNPKQIERSKKMIFGALSAVAVMVLGNFFLTRVIGVSWL